MRSLIFNWRFSFYLQLFSGLARIRSLIFNWGFSFYLQLFSGLARMRSLILGVGGLNKAAAALCAAWFFCAHPSLEQAPLGISTKKPLNFR
jgi:hypothetical protein